MTTELEQEFFKVFGIEPTIIDACKITDEYWNNEELANKYGCFALYMRENCPYDEDCNDNCKYAFDKIEYPEITDRKLLEMICILSAYNYIFEDLKADDIEQLKEEIIKLFFDYPLIAEEEKTNIQQLFKEGE